MGDAEQTLVYRAVKGEDEALIRLLEEASPILHAELEQSIGAGYRGVVEADDILQVTCLEAFLRIGSFEGVNAESFFNWLRRIANNNLLDAIKEINRDKRPSPGRRAAISSDESYVALIEHIAVTTTTPSRVCGQEELRQCVDQALRQLPPDYEQALRLYELEGLSATEVAERMGRRHGAVRMLLVRARERLAEILSANSLFASRV